MKNFRKKFVYALLISIISIFSFSVYANEIESESIKQHGFYNTYTGTVKEITDYQSIKNAKFVKLENEEGAEANFIVTQDTYLVNNVKIVVGAKLIGFYEAGRPMIMIYPPQLSVDIVASASNEEYIKADIFDDELLSADKSLKINISEETIILNRDGTEYKGEIANEKLIVFYTFMTKSIPPQTTPTKLIVLSKSDSIFEPYQDVSSFEIIVSGNRINAPSAYNNDEGAIMVPIRAIAEALGFVVSWNGENQSVILGDDIIFKIGDDSYNIKDKIVKLSFGSELTNATTYVPICFFREIVNNSYVFESQIIIDNFEKVQ